MLDLLDVPRATAMRTLLDGLKASLEAKVARLSPAARRRLLASSFPYIAFPELRSVRRRRRRPALARAFVLVEH